MLDVAGGGSGEDWVNDFTGCVGEAKVAAVKTIGELGVVETEAMQHRRVEVVDVNFVGDRLGTEFVCGAVDYAAFYATASHHDGERLGVVVTAGGFVAVAIFGGLAAKLAAPDDQGAVEQPAFFEVGE